MPHATTPVKVVVLCIDASGAPAFHTCAPEATASQIVNGDHYDLAKEDAERHGYEAPMIAFDAKDSAADQLADVLAWL